MEDERGEGRSSRNAANNAWGREREARSFSRMRESNNARGGIVVFLSFALPFCSEAVENVEGTQADCSSSSLIWLYKQSQVPF